MSKVHRSFRALLAAVVVGAATAACHDTTGPVPATGDRWALVSIDGVALPSQPAALNYIVLADTLEFGVSSSQWTTRPLARARRVVRHVDNSLDTEDWWYTYDSAEPLPTTFGFRALCADGDSAAASCSDGTAIATIDSEGLTIRFNEAGLGVLKYRLLGRPL